MSTISNILYSSLAPNQFQGEHFKNDAYGERQLGRAARVCVPIAQGIAVMLIFFDSDICDRQLEHEYYYVYTRVKCRHVQT